MTFKSAIKNAIFRTKALHKLCVAYCSRNALLPEVFVKMPSAQLRELLFLPKSQRSTQLNQDIFALVANNFQRGFFLEVGANDGFTLSNTIYLEEQFGWDGILVEANPCYTTALAKRRARTVMAAVVASEGLRNFRSAGLYGGVTDNLDSLHEKKTKDAETIQVWGTTLKKLLVQNAAPREIAFISLDVEGGELEIVEQMCDLEEFRFRSGCVEHNFREADYHQMCQMLRAVGYRVVWEGQTQQDLFFVDERVSTASGT
jgi:FkbM family methyltransferase